MKRRPIELMKHTSQASSKWYLLKMLFYVIVLTVLGIIFWKQVNNPTKKDVKEINEIEGVTISTENK